jgi:ketosteroid isomerase-like protein
MAGAGEVVRKFYEAAKKRDLVECRKHVADDLVFVGLFETYRGPDQYLKTFEGLLGITKRLEVKTIIAEGDQAAILFELETGPPAPATVLVAEWHKVSNGKIRWVQSAFDGRPFAAMFSGKG